MYIKFPHQPLDYIAPTSSEQVYTLCQTAYNNQFQHASFLCVGVPIHIFLGTFFMPLMVELRLNIDVKKPQKERSFHTISRVLDCFCIVVICTVCNMKSLRGGNKDSECKSVIDY